MKLIGPGLKSPFMGMKPLYTFFGLIFFVLGAIGAFVPLLPTTPFFLLSIYFSSKSSPKFQNWIESHPVFGPPILDWRQNGIIRLKAKLLASVLIGISMAYAVFFRIESKSLKIITASFLAVVLIFIWSRPSKIKN